MSRLQIGHTAIMFTGGLDSSVLLAKKVRGEEVIPYCISFDDGSPRHKLKREPAIHAVMESLGVDPRSMLVTIPYRKPPLLKNKAGKMETPGYFVNMSMLAMSYAYALGCDTVWMGHNRDNHGRGYPDDKPAVFNRASKFLQAVYGYDVDVELPFYKHSKADIIEIGLQYGLDYSLTYSCDSWTTPGFIHCGECTACMDRKRAFRIVTRDMLCATEDEIDSRFGSVRYDEDTPDPTMYLHDLKIDRI